MLDTISSRLKTKEAKAVLVMAAFGFAVMFIEGLMAQHPAYRLALHHAGDIPLPGSTWFQRPSEINYLAIVMGEDGRAAYVQMLSLDNWRVAARLGVLLSIAWLLLTRGIRRAARRLVATALLYAAIDWLENTILHRVFTFNFLPDFIDDWALYITTCKLVVLAAAYTLGVASLLRAFGSAGAWWTAFFHDVP